MMGDSFAVGLGAVAACVGRGSGQTHAAAGAAARGVRGGLGDALERPSRRWSDATSINGFLFFGFVEGVVAFF